MTIRAILSSKGHNLISVHPQDSVRETVALLTQKRVGAVPVMQDGEVAGIFSERDVIHALAAHGPAALDKPVGTVMTTPAITVGPDETVIGALSLMTRRRIRHLPVVDGYAVIGLVSIGDLVKYRIDRIEADAEALRTYIQSA